MRKLLYAMHFKGRISPAVADDKLLRATGIATSCTVNTSIGPSGVETHLKASDGGLAFLESALRLTGPGSFQEDGTISFGEDNRNVLRFCTIGEGHFTRSPEMGTMAGSASWEVEGGEGQFAEARGFITSAFTLSTSGELSDFHSGVIFLRG